MWDSHAGSDQEPRFGLWIKVADWSCTSQVAILGIRLLGSSHCESMFLQSRAARQRLSAGCEKLQDSKIRMTAADFASRLACDGVLCTP